MTLLVSALNIACALWVGAILFQSAIVAPVVFKTLDEQGARAFLRAVFPRLFTLGIVCGVVMVACAAVLGQAHGFASWRLVILAMSGTMLVLGIIARLQVTSINAARDAGEAGKARFAALHRVNVALTVLVLLTGLAVLALSPRLILV